MIKKVIIEDKIGLLKIGVARDWPGLQAITT
jgi:hypothetical protein